MKNAIPAHSLGPGIVNISANLRTSAPVYYTTFCEKQRLLRIHRGYQKPHPAAAFLLGRFLYTIDNDFPAAKTS